MPPDLTRLRHRQLFELLRHQNLSESTSARLNARRITQSQIDRDDAVSVRLLAMNSWGTPRGLEPGQVA